MSDSELNGRPIDGSDLAERDASMVPVDRIMARTPMIEERLDTRKRVEAGFPEKELSQRTGRSGGARRFGINPAGPFARLADNLTAALPDRADAITADAGLFPNRCRAGPAKGNACSETHCDRLYAVCFARV